MKLIKALLLLSTIVLTGCEGVSERPGITNLPQGSVQKITYKVKNERDEYLELDFVNNTAKYHSWSVTRCAPNPNILACGGDPVESTRTATFTDEQERGFLLHLIDKGFFLLDENYLTEEEQKQDIPNPWKIIVDYEFGPQKVSVGFSKEPTNVFNTVSTDFYDLCGFQVIGTLPAYYIYPPMVNAKISYKGEDGATTRKVQSSHGVWSSGREVFQLAPFQYKWNKKEKKNADTLFELAESNSTWNNVNNFEKTFTTPKLTFSTVQYDCEEKFTNFEFASYDYSRNLSNKQVVTSRDWFYGELNFDLDYEKIYVYKISFANGDFAEYTITTVRDIVLD